MTLPLFDQPRPVTLVRLAGELARAAGGIGLVMVEGEVHRPTTSRGGWVFLTLRDRAAQVTVVIPRPVAARSRVVSGERVAVVGRLEWAPDRGQLSLKADEITPVGAGAIAALMAETRRRLTADGLVGRTRRPLPLLPARIGVVCGADAAVRKDIESVVADRFPGYPLRFEETTVSGPGAALSIVDALERLVDQSGIEVVIVARGGGDATSLLPWSDEAVCRAIAACPVPVVSAIGHDGDRPLCDEVADHRSGTPSMAAATVVPERRALQTALDDRLARASRAVADRSSVALRRLGQVDTGAALHAGVERAALRLVRSGERLAYAHPARHLAAARARLDGVRWREPIRDRLSRASGRLEADGRHLRVLSPERVLQRGFAVVTGPDGSVLRRAASVAAGDLIDITLADGRLAGRVEEVHLG